MIALPRPPRRFALSALILAMNVMGIAALASIALARDPARGLEKKWTVAELIAGLKANPNRPSMAHMLRVAGDKAAIPALRDAFGAASTPVAKQSIAAALVRLGEKDDQYWTYLESRASSAIDADIPIPLAAEGGRYIKGKYSQEFLDWVEQHKMPKEEATGMAIYGHPTDVFFLGLAGDRRAIPILMKGLRSKNFRIVGYAAAGLARLKHKPAIEEIAAACKRLPKEGCEGAAEKLFYFADPKAAELGGALLGDAAKAEKYRKEAAAQGDEGLFDEQTTRRGLTDQK